MNRHKVYRAGRRGAALSALLLLWMGAAGCNEESFAEVGDVELIVNPQSIFFPGVPVGEVGVIEVMIQNTSESEGLLELQIEEDPNAEESEVELAWEDPAQVPEVLTLPGGQSVSLRLAYTPVDVHQDTGRLNIVYNGGRFDVPIETLKIEPNLIVEPPRLAFQRVRAGTRGEQSLELRNEGPALLEISRVYFDDPGGDFKVCLPDGGELRCEEELTGVNVRFTETQELVVRYSPGTDGEDAVGLLIESNDPDEPLQRVEVTGNQAVPCLLINPEEEVALGEVLVGNQASRTVTLQNCSRNADLEVLEVALTEESAPEFELLLVPEPLPETVQPGDVTSVAVSFIPLVEAAYEGGLRIRSNDPSLPEIVLPLSGLGSLDVCPGTVEVCDGIDNDCDGLIDEVSEETCDGFDNDCDGVVDELCPVPQEEAFTVEEVPSRPVDFLVALDTSGSMNDTIPLVERNVATFAERLVTEGVDARMNLIANKDQVCVPEPLAGPSCADSANFTHINRTVNSNDALSILLDCVDGCPRDGGMGYRDLLRPDSLRQILVITDDETTLSWSAFRSGMRNAGLDDFIFYGVIGMFADTCVDTVGSEYLLGVNETGGEALHICTQDWGAIIDTIFDATIERLSLWYELEEVPIDGTLEVLVAPPGAPLEEAAPVDGSWGFNARRNVVAFLVGQQPEPGAQVVIRYDYLRPDAPDEDP